MNRNVPPCPPDSGCCADWPIASVRYYAVDYTSGNDGNIGYSDTSMADAGTKAVKTLTQLRRILPSIGAGRMLVVAIKGGGLTYLKPDGVTPDDLDLRGIDGYAFCLVRGTTDFSDNAADQQKVGGVAAIGTTFTASAGSSSTVTTSGLTAEAALGYRVRFTGNVTAGLTNKCASIWKNTTTIITGCLNWGGTPANGDTFAIEEGGVYVRDLLLNSTLVNGDADGFDVPLQIVGIRFKQNGRSYQQIFARVDVQFTFCKFDLYVPSFREGDVRFLETYATLPSASSLSTIGGNWLGKSADYPNVSFGLSYQGSCSFYKAIGSVDALRIDGCSFLSILSSVFNNQASIRNVGMGNASVSSNTRVSLIGAFNGSSIRPSRWYTAPTGVAQLIGNMVNANFGRCDFSNAGGKPCCVLRGGGTDAYIDQFTSTDGGNTDVGLDIQQSSLGRFAVTTANTLSPTTGEIRIAGAQLLTWASLASDEYRDSAGNQLATYPPTNITTKITPGTVHNAPVLGANPGSPANGDVWITDIAGTRKLNVRIGGVTYSTTLT